MPLRDRDAGAHGPAGGRRRGSGAAAAVAVLCGFVQVVFGAEMATQVMADFESAGDIARWTGLPTEATPTRASSGVQGMQFRVPRWQPDEEERPGVTLKLDPSLRDLSGYGAIVVDAWVEGDSVGHLGLKLRDVHGENSWTTHIAVEPNTRNEARLLISDAAADCDIRDAREVVLYALRPTNTFTLIVDRLRLEPRLPAPPATIHLAYPNYRGWLFPDARDVEIDVEVEAVSEGVGLGDFVLDTRLDQEGRTGTRRVRVGVGRSRGVIPARAFAPGPLGLQATVMNRRTGAELARTNWALRKLSASEVARLKVYVDRGNNLIVDGRPFFPVGWYGSVNEQHLRELADSPFNCVLAYGTDHEPKARMLRFLDTMQQQGLKLVYCLNDVYPTATYLDGKGWDGLEGNDAIAQAVVTAYREHPAVLAWYLNDELPREILPQLKDYHRRVSEADPGHPCFIVLCNRRDFPLFPPTTDILGVDPYPIPKQPVTLVSDFMGAAQRAVKGTQPVWLVPQAFAWYQYNSTNQDRGHVPTPKELRTGRAPTYEEARCMTYLGLAHGAKGLLYYCYYDLRVLPQYAEMWGWMKQIGSEVRSLSHVWLGPDAALKLAVSPSDAAIHTRLVQCDRTLYLIAAYVGTNSCQVQFDVRQRLVGSAKVLCEDRAVPVRGSVFADTFTPLAARVYELRGKPRASH